MKQSFAMINILLLLALSIGLFAAEETATTVSDQTRLNDDVVLIDFEGGNITRKDLDNRISKIPPNQQGRYRTIDGQTQVLEVMALEEVLMQKALQLGTENEADVKSKIEATQKNLFIQEYYKRHVMDKVQLTDEKKHAYFEENPDLFVMLPVVNIAYIQVADEAAGQAALKDLNGGMPWEEASDIHNQNNYIKGLKGVIKSIRLNGNIPGIGTDEDFEEMIKANVTNLNQIIGPFQTSSGWHIFKITEYKEGRHKSYDEVLAEIEQRLRPILEKELLEELRAQLIKDYEVSIDGSLIEQIDLENLKNNETLLPSFAVQSEYPELNYSVEQILDIFERLSPQEQIFYIKGEGARQMIDQELIRALMFLDARRQDYATFFESNEEFNQIKRYYILNSIFRKLVQESIEVPQNEIVAYYESHLADYTTPAARSIQIFWGKDESSAQASRKKFERMFKIRDEARMEQIIQEESKNPNLNILDNQYNNGVVTGIGPDEAFSKMIWENPLDYLSPVFTTARGDIVFFRTLKENPPLVKSFTEMEPRIFGILKKEKEGKQQEKVTKELFEEYKVQKHFERLRMLLSVDELFTLADDSVRLRRFKDAINYYDQIIEHYKNGSDDYKATFMKAFLVAEEMDNTDLAIDLFKAFLIKFPSGELNESAQFMIDALEGNIELDIDEDLEL